MCVRISKGVSSSWENTHHHPQHKPWGSFNHQGYKPYPGRGRIHELIGENTEDKGPSTAQFLFKVNVLSARSRRLWAVHQWPPPAAGKEENLARPRLAMGKSTDPRTMTQIKNQKMPPNSERQLTTSQFQICLMNQMIPFLNSLAKTTFSSSFVCVGGANPRWLYCPTQQPLGTCCYLS